MKLLIRIFVAAGALMLAANVVPGIVVADIYVALIAALVLGLLNGIVRPILVILTLPVTLLTLGLFIFVINAALFGLAASLISGFTVSGFIPALIGSLFVAVVSTVVNKVVA